MHPPLSEIWAEILRVAIEQDVLAIGACPVEQRGDLFDAWLERGFDADMGYLRRNRDVRIDPASRFPWARSAIVIAVAYPAERPSAPADAIARHIARYALGDDYHDVLDLILRRIEETIRDHDPTAETRRYVDTGPLSDRDLAARAGLGWIGRNGMLIHPDHGSWLVIGVLLTNLKTDLPVREILDQCGACRSCIDSCPTGAIVDDRMVDSRKCISWVTIEHRGPIPTDLTDRLEENLFGCDICQEACPWNESSPGPHEALAPRPSYGAKPIHALLRASQQEFSSLFRASAIKRAKRAGIIRNAILITRELPEDVTRLLEEETDSGIQHALSHRMETRK